MLLSVAVCCRGSARHGWRACWRRRPLSRGEERRQAIGRRQRPCSGRKNSFPGEYFIPTFFAEVKQQERRKERKKRKKVGDGGSEVCARG